MGALLTNIVDATTMATTHADQHNTSNTLMNALLPSQISHYLEYTLSYSLADNTTTTPATGWTKVNDTDNAFSAGVATVPAGLGGLWMITCTVVFPAANYGLLFTTFTGLPPQPAGVNPGPRMQTTFTAGAIQQQNAAWIGVLPAAATVALAVIQSSGGARTITADFSMARIGPS
jgi:hypothetical protein